MLPVTKGLGAAAVLVLVFAFGREDPVQWVMASAVAIGLAGWAVRDLVAPVRLAADPGGHGGRRVRPPSSVGLGRDRGGTRGPARTLGIGTEMLEVDADDALYLYSMHDLGADPHEVHEVLKRSAPGRDAQESADTVR